MHFKWINNIMIPVIFDWGRDREGERRGEKGSRGGYFSHPILSKYPMNNADGYYIIGLDQGMILFFEKGIWRNW